MEVAGMSASKATNHWQGTAQELKNLASVSLSSILDVVPEDTSEWKPEMAPQAMVTKRNGNSLPLMMGPPPWMNWVNAGKRKSGWTMKTPTMRMAIVPSLT